MARLRLCFIVESGTDVRMVEGLAEHFELSVLARRIEGGVEISHPPRMNVPLVVGPAGRLRFARLVWRELRQRRESLDAVLVQGYGLAALAANLASRGTGTATRMLVCSPVEAYYRCRREHAEPGKPFRRRELWGIQRVARMNAWLGGGHIVLSKYLTEVVREHGAKNTEVIPVYGVDTSLFKPSTEDKRTLKEQRGLPTNGKLIFFSSRIAPEKDSEILLEAVRTLTNQGRDLWILHRSGGYRHFLEQGKQYGLERRMIATDAVHPHQELPLDYQAADICVQASREEGLGFSPLEALASGVPVVAAAVGGLRETVVDGETGWTYPRGDAPALAGCLEAVVNDPQEATRRAENGRKMVAATYDRRLVFERLAAYLHATCQSDSG